MKDGDNDEALSGALRDDGQGGVHRCGTARRDGSEVAEPSYHQRSTEQGHDFTGNIREQGYRTQFRSFIFGDEDARQRIVAEARTYRHTFRCAAMGEEQANQSCCR